MSDKIKEEINRIQIPSDIHERALKGVKKAKLDMSSRRKERLFTIVPIAISMMIVTFGGYSYISNQSNNQHSSLVLNTPLINKALKIPPALSKNDNGQKKMIGLIVYKGKIYTQSATKVDSIHAKKLVGEKLGSTKFGIDEWSSQDDYTDEFASTIGEANVYSVNGYDQNFRIMTYIESEGAIIAEFFDCLNGITVQNGEDVFGKLHLTGNIVNVEYRNYNDWNNSVENYHPINDMKIINAVVNSMNKSKPYTQESIENEIGDFSNEAQFKELFFHLTDGSIVTMSVIKDGYISYGSSGVYFKMEKEVFGKFWQLLDM
ncbi:hypothetical protein [Bacillus sp. EAC]|uniref:hypothetical protein n=1 Tax=Bacillus sp. EAC TaxID=1978338 RepID=UPI000B42E80E|nr:hypothetical protein [Bacillus sp. EAC]